MSPSSSVLLLLGLCCVVTIAIDKSEPYRPCHGPKVRPGLCMREPTCIIPPKKDGVCTKDCHCPEEKKCCVNNCEYKCMDPWDGVKPGECEDNPPCLKPPKEDGACTKDYHCSGRKKCCITDCDYACVFPRDGART
ncbi:WAP four-disulfide core domain protein 5-like [Hyperolius riggenbachi]|uniref:WAP four-disulfide core domain protein 5-like n=1 Tax=Hyperolius riggenbachi TaxID=752182 RepID=UPI0035A30585